ncbi:MAG: hypothetical protein ACP5OO_05080 [Chloroflexia bacterium]
MQNDKRSSEERTGHWLKGTWVRFYTAQRDHFLELHARREEAVRRSRPKRPAQEEPETP